LESGSYLRLGVSVRYAILNAPDVSPSGNASRFFWTTARDAPEWSADSSVSMAIADDGNVHGYWLVVPSIDVRQEITGLRYDLLGDGAGEVEIRWISAEVVR
jgi:hypothetical protein